MAGGIRRLIFTDKAFTISISMCLVLVLVGALNISTRRYLNRHATPFKAIQGAARAPVPLISRAVNDNNLKIFPLTSSMPA